MSEASAEKARASAPCCPAALANDGGTQPRWRRDRKGLYYISNERTVMAVDVTTTSPSAAQTTAVTMGRANEFRMVAVHFDFPA